MKKRGQITLFIILGVIILFAVFTFFFIRSRVVKRAIIEEIPAVVSIPIEFEPIRQFTQECLEKVGTEGLKLLGEGGGYIYFEDFGISVSSQNPTEADALEFAPNSGLYVPYWWYLKAPNDCRGNCLFSSLRPPLYRITPGDRSIEAQVDRYIEEEIGSCLNNYNAFKVQGYEITPTGEFKSITRVTSSNVALFLNYPLKVELADKTHRVDNFYGSIPVNMRRIYDLATGITNIQIEYKVFEKQALDLIDAYSGLDPNRLPPFSHTEFGTDPSVIWLRTKVKEKIEEILMIYVPAFQVYDTLNFVKRNFPDPLQAALYESVELPINLSRDSQPYSDLAVTFNYLAWWPIYFDINSKGEIIKGQSLLNDLAELFSLGSTKYNNVYDLSYPVVVEIRDPAALREEGYTFRFALESNFRNNEFIDESFQGFEPVPEFQSSLLCNENQRNSGNVTIKVVDESTDEPIQGVSVGFQCGDQGCQIGATDENGTLISRFPLCFGGLLVLDHIDYYMPTLYLSVDFNDTIEFPTVRVYPYIDKEVRVLKYLTSSLSTEKVQDGGKPTTQAVPLGADEEVVLSLSRQNDFVGEDPFTAIAKVTNTTSSLRLVPGTYEVEMSMFYHQPVIIPEDKREEGSWPFEEEYTIPEVKFDDDYFKGGAIFNNQTGYLIISPNNLYKDNNLTFFIVDTPLPEKIEHIFNQNILEKLSSQFRPKLEPRYIAAK
ncbi:hypothetical protein KY331_05150 [Candidatus Woesearchaeota archaeon]|nr:hypothetical protein [Candidatus Woesearchaeota archaeon]